MNMTLKKTSIAVCLSLLVVVSAPASAFFLSVSAVVSVDFFPFPPPDGHWKARGLHTISVSGYTGGWLQLYFNEGQLEHPPFFPVSSNCNMTSGTFVPPVNGSAQINCVNARMYTDCFLEVVGEWWAWTFGGANTGTLLVESTDRNSKRISTQDCVDCT